MLYPLKNWNFTNVFQTDNFLVFMKEKPLKIRFFGETSLNHKFMINATSTTITSFIVLLQSELNELFQ